MMEFSLVKRHVADEITLLCPAHHAEVTSGMLPRENVASANTRPYNRRKGTAVPRHLHFSGTSCEVRLGGNSFTFTTIRDGETMHVVVIDGLSLLAFTVIDQQLLLSLTVHGDDGKKLVEIAENELTFAVAAWDVHSVGRNLIVRQAAHDVVLDITFEPPRRITINKGRFTWNGVDLIVDTAYALVVNNHLLLNDHKQTGVVNGLVLGNTDIPGTTGLRATVEGRSRSDRRAAQTWADDQMKLIRQNAPTRVPASSRMALAQLATIDVKP